MRALRLRLKSFCMSSKTATTAVLRHYIIQSPIISYIDLSKNCLNSQPETLMNTTSPLRRPNKKNFVNLPIPSRHSHRRLSWISGKANAAALLTMRSMGVLLAIIGAVYVVVSIYVLFYFSECTTSPAMYDVLNNKLRF